MKAKALTRQLMALLLSLCLLLSGISVAAGEEITASAEQETGRDRSVEEREGGDTDADSDADDIDIESNTEYENGEVHSDHIDKDMADVSSDAPGNEATASVEDGTLQVEAGDVEEGGISVGTVVEGEDSDIYVTVGDEPVDTEDAFDDQGEPVVEDVDVTVGDVTGDDYGISVSSYDYDEKADIDVTVSAGDVTVNGDNGATGIIVYDYESNVEISTGDVSVNGGTDEGVGVEVTVEGQSQVDIEVQGDVDAEGEGGMGIRVQGTETEGGSEDSQVNVVVTGTVSGTDAAIQVSEDMAKNTDVTAWAVEENEDGALAQVIDADGEVNEEASSLFERAIQYIVMVAEEFKNRLSVSTGHTVTVGKGDGEETYQTAAEGEEVTLQVKLDKNQELKGVYYNNDLGTKAEYTQDGDNFLVKMLREGAMLLGLDIGRKKPEPRPEPMPIEYDEDNDEHHSHSTRSRRTEFVYVPYPKNVSVHGVSAADDLTAQQTANKVSISLNGGYQYVDIKNKALMMNDGDLAQFDALSLEDRMLVMMAAMGLSDTTGEFRATMSDAARALAAAIDSRVAELSDGERTARMEEVNKSFPPRQITLNGAAYESVGIVLIIDTNGNQSYERYVFYDDNGVWKLHQIEEGKYIVVD